MAPLFCLFHNLHKQPLQIMALSNACRFIPVKVNEAETPADDDAFALFLSFQTPSSAQSSRFPLRFIQRGVWVSSFRASFF